MRVFRIRQGFNPNSSSLSVNMTVLLAATGLVSLGTYLVSAATLLFVRKHREPPPPRAPADAPPPRDAPQG